MMIFKPDVNVGDKFGRLTFVSLAHRSPTSRQWYWNMKCECGKDHVVMGSNVRNGGCQSCGCLQKERAGDGRRTHGRTGTRLYRIWKNMRSRCLNPKSTRYADYGGRGIKICQSWLDSFENFKADLGEPPTINHSMDRKNNDGNYEPLNVRWELAKAQCRNQRRSVMVNVGGTMKHIKDLCEERGFNYYRAYDLIVRRKIDVQTAIKLLEGNKESPVV